MAILKIDTVSDSGNVLRKKAELVGDVASPEIQTLIDDMWETLATTDSGVGLAAPQVGKSVQIMLVKIDGYEQTIINPKIISRNAREKTDEEGCLSVPDKWKKVKRSASVEVSYIDRDGFEISSKLKERVARVFLHEYDHLNGILFTDR